MKKFLSIFTMLAVLMTTTPALASDMLVNTSQGDFIGQTDISYRVYSSYYVSIPTSINADDTYGEISVSMANVESGYHVSVYITNLTETGKITVTSESGNTGYLQVTRDNGLYNVGTDGLVTEFYQSDYTDGGIATTNIGFDSAGELMKPGLYNGTVCFRIECRQDGMD